MNNQRPGMGEQLLRSLLLSFAAMWIISYFFGWPGQPKPGQQATRDPKLEARATLDNAFADLKAGAQSAPSPEKAQAEIASLQKEIAANGGDKYAYWARLRSGLLSQYVLRDWGSASKNYDEIIRHGAPDAVDAQAIFQKGDWQWHAASAPPASTSTSAPSSTPGAAPLPTRQEATTTLETLVHRGKTASAYTDILIYVPNLPASADAAALAASTSSLPAQGFRAVKVGELKGTLDNPNPQGVLDRVNQFYSTTTLNRGMDVLVNLFGARPEYSYGLAIILLAILLRVLMQPINRRQYDSMKGMAVIGPDMKKIQEKYKAKPSDSPEVQRDKQMKAFAEIRELQKTHGVNPQMGCALMFVQMPIFFYFINPLMMHYEPKMALAGASFLWVNNLAYSDNLLLGLYGLSMLVSFRLSSTPPTDDMQRQMQLMTTFVFPIMLPFFMRGFSSAFILYWMAFNVVSMIFQYRMMKGSDPDKSVLKTLFAPISLSPTAPATGSASAGAAVPPRPKALKSKTIVTDTPVDGADSNTVKVKTIAPAGARASSSSRRGSRPSSEVESEVSEAAPVGAASSLNGAASHAGASNGSVPGQNSGQDGARPERERGPAGRKSSSAQRARRRRRY
jgi:YidC/Oxa1 family membrane protein insertase